MRSTCWWARAWGRICCPTGSARAASRWRTCRPAIGSAVLLKRPDVVQAEDLLKAQNANIGAARAAFFPTISLTAAAGTASSALSGLFTGGTWSWNASGSSALTLFDFGRNRANLRYAEASRDAAVATYEKSVQTAFREVSDALAQRGTIDEQVAARMAKADSAGVAARLSEARYRNGIDSFLTTLDAQRTLYSAEQALVTTRLARESKSRLALQRAGRRDQLIPCGGGLIAMPRCTAGRAPSSAIQRAMPCLPARCSASTSFWTVVAPTIHG